MGYRLTKEDVEWWAEQYAHHLKLFEQGYLLATKSVLQFAATIAAQDSTFSSPEEAVYGHLNRALPDILGAGGAVCHAWRELQKIEETIGGRRGSRIRKKLLEQVKDRAQIEHLLATLGSTHNPD